MIQLDKIRLKRANKNVIPLNENKGVNIIYIPEKGNNLANFINKSKWGRYIHNILVPKINTFFDKRDMNSSKNIKDTKEMMAQLEGKKPVVSFNEIKTPQTLCTIYDASKLINLVYELVGKRSNIAIIRELLAKLALIKNTFSDKETIIVIDSSIQNEEFILQGLIRSAREAKERWTLPNDITDLYILSAKEQVFYPVGYRDKDKNGNTIISFDYVMANRVLNNQEMEDEEIIAKKFEVTTTDNTKKETSIDILSVEQREDLDKIIKDNNIKDPVAIDTISNMLITNDAEKVNEIVNNSSEKELIDKNIRNIYRTNIAENTTNTASSEFFNVSNLNKIKSVEGVNRHQVEFNDSMHDNIKRLFMTMVTDDPELKLDVLDFKHKLIDDKMNRIIEYSVKIKHNIGSSRAYTVKFRVPYLVEGKYLKLRGNRWVMVNQQIRSVLSKISNEKVTLNTNYSSASVMIKNLSNSSSNFKDSEEFFTNLNEKYIKSKETMSSEEIETFAEKYGLPVELAMQLGYKSMVIEK